MCRPRGTAPRGGAVSHLGGVTPHLEVAARLEAAPHLEALQLEALHLEVVALASRYDASR